MPSSPCPHASSPPRHWSSSPRAHPAATHDRVVEHHAMCSWPGCDGKTRRVSHRSTQLLPRLISDGGDPTKAGPGGGTMRTTMREGDEGGNGMDLGAIAPIICPQPLTCPQPNRVLWMGWWCGRGLHMVLLRWRFQKAKSSWRRWWGAGW
jgi:hypothetical protein